MKDLRWTHVTVIALVLAVLGFLTYSDKDGAAIIGGALALLAALGFVASKQSDLQETAATIKDQTNGNIGQLMAMMEQMRQDMVASGDQHRRDMKEMADKLAMMSPPSDGLQPPNDLNG